MLRVFAAHVGKTWRPWVNLGSAAYRRQGSGVEHEGATIPSVRIPLSFYHSRNATLSFFFGACRGCFASTTRRVPRALATAPLFIPLTPFSRLHSFFKFSAFLSVPFEQIPAFTRDSPQFLRSTVRLLRDRRENPRSLAATRYSKIPPKKKKKKKKQEKTQEERKLAAAYLFRVALFIFISLSFYLSFFLSFSLFRTSPFPFTHSHPFFPDLGCCENQIRLYAAKLMTDYLA